MPHTKEKSIYLRKSNETEFSVYTVGKMKFVIFQVTGVFVEAEVITAGKGVVIPTTV